MDDKVTVTVTVKELKEAFESEANYNRFRAKLIEKLREKENEEKKGVNE